VALRIFLAAAVRIFLASLQIRRPWLENVRNKQCANTSTALVFGHLSTTSTWCFKDGEHSIVPQRTRSPTRIFRRSSFGNGNPTRMFFAHDLKCCATSSWISHEVQQPLRLCHCSAEYGRTVRSHRKLVQSQQCREWTRSEWKLATTQKDHFFELSKA